MFSYFTSHVAELPPLFLRLNNIQWRISHIYVYVMLMLYIHTYMYVISNGTYTQIHVFYIRWYIYTHICMLYLLVYAHAHMYAMRYYISSSFDT